MKLNVIAFLSIATAVLNFAFADTQEWFASPRISYGEVDAEYRSCIEQQIIKQFGYPADTNIFSPGVLPRPQGDSQILTMMYCVQNEQRKCKQAYKAVIPTRDPRGWQNDFSQAPTLVVRAQDMGRFVDFKDYKTDAFHFRMDLWECRKFFGVK